MKSRTSSVIGSVLSPLLIALLLQGCGAPPDKDPGEALCGDAIVDASEQCDDGNLLDGDGCSADCQLERSEEESQAIDEYVAEVGKLDVPEQGLSEELDFQDNLPSQSPSGESLLCSVAETREVRLIDNFTSQGAVAKRIYPGVLFDGNSLANGAFNEIPLDKKPLTVSIDLPQQTTSATMEDPSLSDFRAAQQELIFAGLEERGGEPALPKNTFVERIATVNEEQLSLELGFNVNAGIASNVDVAGQFNFNDTNKRSRYLLRIVNELYTVAIDKPAGASEFLADNVSLDAVQNAFQAGNPPVYVDTITYGRVIYVAVESSFSASELDAALQVAVSGVGFDVDTEFGVSSREILQETVVKGIGLGLAEGDIEDLGAIQGVEDLEAFFRLATRVPSVTDTTFGEPISFTVAYLTDNTQTISVVEGTYTTESCQLAPEVPEETTADFHVDVNQLNLIDVHDGGTFPNFVELRGTIEVSFGGESVFLFDLAQGEQVQLGEGPISGSEPFFLEGDLTDVDITSGSEVTVTINLVEVDGGADDVHSISDTIDIEDVLAGEGIIDLNFGTDNEDGKLEGNLRIGFEQL